MKKIKAIADLIRADHGLMLGIAVVVGFIISAKGFFFHEKIIFSFLTAFFLEAGTFALNDYFDYEVDKKNKRFDRPLVRGDIKPETALAIYFITSPIGILFSIFVNKTCFLIALTNLIIATFYDVKFKEIKVIGNFYIAFIMAIPFVFGALAYSEEISKIIIFFAILAFLSGLGREIMKDIMDFYGDMERRTKSFPLYIGEKNSRYLSSLLFIFSSIIAFIPFFVEIDSSYYLNPLFFLFLCFSSFLFIYSSYLLIKGKEIATPRKLTLLAIFFGLIAFLAGMLRLNMCSCPSI
ncbi:MAG: UbiA family prenyltransferase [Thermoplasmatales archaeon]|nr:UbiA family prenyltransferase [Thermoplasmatales archaeon]